MRNHPRLIDPQHSFDAIVDWIYNNIIFKRGCPGIIIGISGTDSLVAFLAAYKAFERAGKPHRVLGIHFAPSEDFLCDYPEAQTHMWFANELVPYLRTKAPSATVIVDTSIDWRCDGLRWGKLADMSVVFTIDRDGNKRVMRAPEEQYWLLGTRNRTEDVMFSYSNASNMASIQPIVHLWKSEVLQLSRYLGIPQTAIAKSCEVDCICGRERTPASYPRELDLVLMAELVGELDKAYLEQSIPNDLRKILFAFATDQCIKHSFKKSIPYRSDVNVDCHTDELVQAFENCSLDLRTFNHRKHIYVAWYYLRVLPFKEALERYTHYLCRLLDVSNQSHRFNLEVTQLYFHQIDNAMKEYKNTSFDELMDRTSHLWQNKGK